MTRKENHYTPSPVEEPRRYYTGDGAPHGGEHHEVDEGRAPWHRFEGGRPSRTRRWRVRGARARVQGAASAEQRGRVRGGERVRGARVGGGQLTLTDCELTLTSVCSTVLVFVLFLLFTM